MRIKLIIAFLFIGSSLIAQQRVQHSQYMLNGFLINPAVTGAENYIDIKAGYSHQWVGFDGGPKNHYISGHAALNPSIIDEPEVQAPKEVLTPPLSMRGRNHQEMVLTAPEEPQKLEEEDTLKLCQKIRHGVGGVVHNESMASVINRGLQASYALHIPIGKYKVSAGINLGFLNYEFNPDNIRLINADDITFGVTQMNEYVANVNIGAMVYNDQLFIGIASNQLLGNKLEVLNEYSNLTAQLNQHYYVNCGYRLHAMNNDLELVPSLLVKYVKAAPIALDINITGTYKKLLAMGLSYRHKDALVVMTSLNIKDFITIGYAYDFTISSMANYSTGTHGIVVGFRIPQLGVTTKRYYW